MRRLALTSGKGRALRLVFVAASLFVITGCTTDDDEGQTPTAAPADTAVPVATETTAPQPLNRDEFLANSQVVTDLQCQALVPSDWVDDGTGRGSTSSGALFEVFGGFIRDDADWERAVSSVATPASGPSVAEVRRDETSVTVTFVDGRGFEYRERFDTRYCDFRVESRFDEIPEIERAVWPFIVESLEPVGPQA